MSLRFCIGGLLFRAIGPGDIGRERDHQDRARHPPDGPERHGDRAEHGGAGQRQRIAPEGRRGDGERQDDRGNAENEQDIGDVRAQHIAERDPRRAGQRGLDAGSEFRHRSAEADDGQPGEQRGYPQRTGQADRAAHQQLAADCQQHQSAEDKRQRHGAISSASRMQASSVVAPVASAARALRICIRLSEMTMRLKS